MKMKNIQADSQLRESIAGSERGSAEAR
jgi:uncharacterized protein YqfA (UPF0365 family)